MSGSEHGKRGLKVLSHIDFILAIQELAIQVKSADVKDLLEDAAKADETHLYIEEKELARILWERIGNADVVDVNPPIGEEIFYLVGLKDGEGSSKIGDVVVYRCVTARGVWL